MAIINRQLKKKRISDVSQLIYKRVVRNKHRIKSILDIKDGDYKVSNFKIDTLSDIFGLFLGSIMNKYGEDFLDLMVNESKESYSKMRERSVPTSMFPALCNIIIIDRHSKNYNAFVEAIDYACSEVIEGWDDDYSVKESTRDFGNAKAMCVRIPFYMTNIIRSSERHKYLVPAIIPFMFIDHTTMEDEVHLSQCIIHEASHILDYCNKNIYLKRILKEKGNMMMRYMNYYDRLFNRDTEIVAYMCNIIALCKKKKLTTKRLKVLAKVFIKSGAIPMDALRDSGVLKDNILKYKSKRNKK